MMSSRRLLLLAVAGFAFCTLCAFSETPPHGDASSQHMVPVSSPVDADTDDETQETQRQRSQPRRNAVFEPTHEWREVPRDEDIPAGLDVRMDLSEGKRYARLIPGSRMEKIVMEEREREAEAREREQAMELARAAEASDEQGSAESRPNASVDEESANQEVNPFDRTEMMERVLRSLPGPREEIESAVRRRYTREQIEALIQQVWERRQRELEEAMASFQTEADGMRSIMFQLLNDTLVPEQQAELLHELDYFVTTAHNAEDFARMGGLTLTMQFIQNPVPKVRDAALVTLGSAVKYAAENQEAALEAGAMQMLLQNAESLAHAVDADCMYGGVKAGTWRDVAKHMYTIGSMLRQSPPAQSQFVALEGPAVLERILGACVGEDDSMEETSARVKASVKLLTILEDLAVEHSVAAARSAEAKAAAAREGTSGGPNVVMVDKEAGTAVHVDGENPQGAADATVSTGEILSPDVCHAVLRVPPLVHAAVYQAPTPPNIMGSRERLVRSMDTIGHHCADAWQAADTDEARNVLEVWLGEFRDVSERRGAAGSGREEMRLNDDSPGEDAVDAALDKFEAAVAATELLRDVQRITRVLRHFQ